MNVVSAIHKRAEIDFDDLNSSKKVYNAKKSYEQSELAIVMSTREASQRFRGKNVTVNCVNPGMSRTDITRHSVDNSIISRNIVGPFLSAFLKTPIQGAQAVIQCALDPQLNGQTGKYFR